MATSSSVCAVCDLQHKTSQSTHWCIECEEPLCADCKKHHNVLKATRSHKTIPISDYQLLPSVVTDIKQHCIYHNEIYQLYCNKHENPICNKCVKDHGKCGDILHLDDVVRDIKTSESFVDLEQSLDDLSTNINKIRKDRESNIESITDQKLKITAQICLLKKQVIQHVEKLEEEFIKELDQIEFDCCGPIHLVVSSLQVKAKEINQMKSEIQSTKKYASDLQTFLSIKEIQVKTTELEKHLQSSNQNKYHEKTIIKSAIDTKIQDILTLDRFCSIEVKKSPSFKFDLKNRKDRQAQIMVLKPIQLIKEIKIEIKQKLFTACMYPVGCCVTNKDEFLFTDYVYNNGQVTAINFEGEVEYTIPLKEPYQTFDVAYLEDNKIAVSTGHSSIKRGVSFVDLTKRKQIKFIDLPDSSYGITYDGKSLICCVKGKDLHVISCVDYNITTIPNTVSSDMSYVSTHADKIIYTNPDKHTMTCCLYSGILEWEFNDPVLGRPRGLTVDNTGNVFAVGTCSSNVIGISPNGEQHTHILTKADDLERPIALFFDKVKKQLIVTNEKQFASVYNVSYS